MKTDIHALKDKVITAIKTCFDPEIPVNVYDLGLIYRVEVSDQGNVEIDMTLTSPNCPSIEELPDEVQQKIQAVDEVKQVELNLVWDPPFTQELMSDEAKLALGLL